MAGHWKHQGRLCDCYHDVMNSPYFNPPVTSGCNTRTHEQTQLVSICLLVCRTSPAPCAGLLRCYGNRVNIEGRVGTSSMRLGCHGDRDRDKSRFIQKSFMSNGEREAGCHSGCVTFDTELMKEKDEPQTALDHLPLIKDRFKATSQPLTHF